MSDTETVRVADLQVGDMIDLEGDKFADPNRDRIEFECEFATVHEIEREAPGAVAIYWDTGGYCFPADHEVQRRA